MPITDIHAHLFTDDLLAAMADTGMARPPQIIEEPDGQVSLLMPRGHKMGPIPPGIRDVEQRLADMDEQGVEIQVLAVAPMLFGYDEEPNVASRIASATNDVLLEIARAHPERFQVFASLPMSTTHGVMAELDRIGKDPLVRGIEIGSHIAGTNLDDEGFKPIWEELEARGLPVLVHPYAVAGGNRMPRYHLSNLVGNPTDSSIAIASLIFGGVVDRHPDLRFGFVHGGGFAPYQIGRWDHGWSVRPEARVHIDQPPSVFFHRLFFDSLTHDELSLEFLGRRVGWDHVALGSDYPFDMSPKDPVGAVRKLGLSESDEAAVLEGNPERFLRTIQ